MSCGAERHRFALMIEEADGLFLDLDGSPGPEDVPQVVRRAEDSSWEMIHRLYHRKCVCEIFVPLSSKIKQGIDVGDKNK